MSEIHVAMMNLLWPRRGLLVSVFHDYWSGAHTQISSRLPGIHQYFQHHLDPDLGKAFPGSRAWTESRNADFRGDAEITFASEEDLRDFAARLNPLMQDEQNVFDKTISYQAPGAFTATLRDETDDDSPNGDLGTNLKYFVYVHAPSGMKRDDFRTMFVKDVAQPLAENADVAKVRYRLLNYYDNEAVTLLAPGVDNSEAPGDQFDACLEVVFPDALAEHRFAGSAACTTLQTAIGELSAGVACMRALRTFTVYNHGRITLAGLRTPQMAAQIMTLGATNQLDDENYLLMLGEHPFLRRYGGQ